MSTNKTEPFKSWKKINHDRKTLKKQYKQEKVLKNLEKAKKLVELTKALENNGTNLLAQEPLSTISIAVPGSILENAQSAELRTYLAGQIARAACIFQVDEVVIYDDIGVTNIKSSTVNNFEGEQNVRDSCLQLARILQYLECPQYLRKFFFPLHNDLKYSGLLNPLDAPHHLRQQNIFLYREGVVIDKKSKNDKGCFVNVGLLKDVFVDKNIAHGIRVTVRMDNLADMSSKKLKGTVVSPDEPRQKTGIYWGYSVRVAHSLSEVFTKSPFKGGYDLTLGTSDKGTLITEFNQKSLEYNHMLILFGGLKGLECAIENDEKLEVEDPKHLFDHYLNVLPSQGSRTVRTEEAILIAMSSLQEKLNPKQKSIEFSLSDYIPQSEDTGVKNIFK